MYLTSIRHGYSPIPKMEKLVRYVLADKTLTDLIPLHAESDKVASTLFKLALHYRLPTYQLVVATLEKEIASSSSGDTRSTLLRAKSPGMTMLLNTIRVYMSPTTQDEYIKRIYNCTYVATDTSDVQPSAPPRKHSIWSRKPATTTSSADDGTAVKYEKLQHRVSVVLEMMLEDHGSLIPWPVRQLFTQLHMLLQQYSVSRIHSLGLWHLYSFSGVYYHGSFAVLRASLSKSARYTPVSQRCCNVLLTISRMRTLMPIAVTKRA